MTSASNEPFKLQIALQGGGAKIVALIAAMEAVQKLQRTGVIRVTRTAGTSAGAIVAALFAADVDLGPARRDLLGVARQIVSVFPPPSPLAIFWRLLIRKRPLWDEQRLARILKPLFDQAGVYHLSELQAKTGTHVHVVASQLSDRSKIVQPDDKPIIAALLDSCAIPYCFRIWHRSGNPVIVDGGICENLPSDELLPHEEHDGPVVGISFDPAWPGTPENIRTFSLALLDTAINNSVARAKQKLGSDRVFSINTGITTFDFDAASRFTDAEAYEVRDKATRFFTNFVAERRKIAEKKEVAGDPWNELNISIMEDLWRVYQSQYASRTSTYEHCSLVVQVNSLVDDARDALHGAPDFVYYSTRFRPLEPLYCSMLALIPSEGTSSMYSSEITLRAADGTALSYVLMPVRDPETPSKRPALLFFTPPVAAGTGPYTLELKHRIHGFMSKLKYERKDWLFFSSKRAANRIGQIDLVIHVPKRFGQVHMFGKGDGKAGRSMTAIELAGYVAPPGFISAGWRGVDLPAKTTFEAEVQL